MGGLEPSYNLSDQDKEALYGDDWTKSSQYKLISWRSEALQLSRRHCDAGFKSKRLKYLIGMPILLLSGTITVLLAITEQTPNQGYSVATIIISGVVTFLSALNTFLAPSEKYIAHIHASNAYANVARSIDYVVTLPPQKRPDVEVAYVQATSELNNIATAAPPLRYANQRRKEPNFDDMV
jgi:hypothetical protein